MKPAILLLLPIVLTFAANSGLAQGFRGARGGGPGAWGQSRPPSNTNLQQPRGFIGFRSHRYLSPSQSFFLHAVPGQTFIFHNRRSGIAFASVPFVHRFAPLRWAPIRYTSYPHSYYRRHPGVVIIDVPGYVALPATAPHAPGVSYGGPPMVEDSSERITGRGPGQIAPFDPTPQEVVERALTLARMNSDDVLYDLGSGDGRLVIAAAKKYGAKAVGFEIDPGLVKLARENARRDGVENLVEFRQQDFLTADLSPASVVTLYLSYDGNLAVRPHLMSQLKAGARVVSYTFDMGDWPPRIAESYRDNSGNTHMLYFWEVGEPQAFSDAR